MSINDLVGCVSPNGYGYRKASAMDRISVLRGRPRYRLRDTHPIYYANVTINMDETQFEAWQAEWAGPIDYGKNTFVMRLMMDDIDVWDEYDELYTVRATGPWSAVSDHADRYVVSMEVEVPGGVVYQFSGCDSIYGGPITGLATDDIYGGPITGLATDIIEPCQGVLG